MDERQARYTRVFWYELSGSDRYTLNKIPVGAILVRHVIHTVVIAHIPSPWQG